MANLFSPQVLNDCLLRMKSSERDKHELMSSCISEYEGNFYELDIIHEFQEQYAPERVIEWYTRDSFFYKTLNAALRKQNIHMIFLYRSFIADIYHELQKYQLKDSLNVYRTQLMSCDELDALKRNIGQFISVNSFLSTSRQRETAIFFLGDTSQPIALERVLFEIAADPRVVIAKPFADISKHSEFDVEEEVLFMFGSIFRINNISSGEDQIWTIQMSLCNDDEHEFQQVLTRMKSQNGNGKTDLRTLGKVLWKMGKFDLAEKYYCRFIEEMAPNDARLTTLYEELAEIASQRGDYDSSIQWHQKSDKIERQRLSTNLTSPLEPSSATGKCDVVRLKLDMTWEKYE